MSWKETLLRQYRCRSVFLPKRLLCIRRSGGGWHRSGVGRRARPRMFPLRPDAMVSAERLLPHPMRDVGMGLNLPQRGLHIVYPLLPPPENGLIQPDRLASDHPLGGEGLPAPHPIELTPGLRPLGAGLLPARLYR